MWCVTKALLSSALLTKFLFLNSLSSNFFFYVADEQLLAIASGKIRIFRWESGKELLKFSADGAS